MTAEDRLASAIADVLEEQGFMPGDALLGDWHVMAEVTLLGEDDRGQTRYVNVIPGTHGTPMHRVIGLIQVCTDLLGEEE